MGWTCSTCPIGTRGAKTLFPSTWRSITACSPTKALCWHTAALWRSKQNLDHQRALPLTFQKRSKQTYSTSSFGLLNPQTEVDDADCGCHLVATAFLVCNSLFASTVRHSNGDHFWCLHNSLYFSAEAPFPLMRVFRFVKLCVGGMLEAWP